MKRVAVLSFSLLVLCAIAFGQTSSYRLKISDIKDVEIDAGGWLVGKGLPDADDQKSGSNSESKLDQLLSDIDDIVAGKRKDHIEPSTGHDHLVTKVTYPIRFIKKAGQDKLDIKAWKFGSKAFIAILLKDKIYSSIWFVTVSLDIPSVQPIWNMRDISDSEPLGQGLSHFAERAGVDQATNRGFTAFFGPGSKLNDMAENHADVNNFDEAKDKRLLLQFRDERLDFFNKVLSATHGSRYDALGYSKIKLPEHLMRLARHFRGVKVPNGPDLNDLMLLNRCLIDGVGAEAVGFFQGDTYDLVTEAEFNGLATGRLSVTRCPVFPIKTVLGIRDRGLDLLPRPLQMRLLTPDEVTELRKTDPRTLYADKAGPIPRDASNEDLEPFAVLESGPEKWYISKAGYWIGKSALVSKRRRDQRE